MATPTTINILLINPNNTTSMTTNCINIVQPTLPPDVTVHPFTAPHPAPTAIESQVDAILSSAASFRALLPLQTEHNYDIFDCKLLAIICTTEEWQYLLEGNPHPVETWLDHKNLTFFKSPQDLN